MAESFGPLEHFRVFLPSATVNKDFDSVPPEHRFRRSKDMDGAIWEVKWGHRDDCITAFNVSGTFLTLFQAESEFFICRR